MGPQPARLRRCLEKAARLPSLRFRSSFSVSNLPPTAPSPPAAARTQSLRRHSLFEALEPLPRCWKPTTAGANDADAMVAALRCFEAGQRGRALSTGRQQGKGALLLPATNPAPRALSPSASCRVVLLWCAIVVVRLSSSLLCPRPRPRIVVRSTNTTSALHTPGALRSTTHLGVGSSSC